MKHISSFVLALLLLANICACQGETPETDIESTTGTDTTLPEETTAEELSLELPEANFDGYTVHIDLRWLL